MRVSVKISTVSIAAWLLAPVAGHAFPGILSDFTDRYPSATRLDNCGTCHNSFTSGAGLNAYGIDLASNDEDFAAIESNDSDGDGTTNLNEINTDTGFAPGFTCETYTGAANAPEDLADWVDPVNVGCETGGTTTTVDTTTSTTPDTTSTTQTSTSTTQTSTSTTNTSTSTSSSSTSTTTLPGGERCGQPVTTGPTPLASDCLFILRAAVGSETCTPACICDVTGGGGTTASDALQCLRKSVGQDVELSCDCDGGTTTSTSPTSTITTSTTSPTSTSTTTVTSPTSTSTSTTTGGGGNIEAGRAIYDSECSFCHSAGSHDTESELASDMAGDGDKLVPDLGTLDESMDGIILSEQEIADLAAFFDSL